MSNHPPCPIHNAELVYVAHSGWLCWECATGKKPWQDKEATDARATNDLHKMG